MAEEADSSSGPLFPRRIEFHLATKPFLGFVKSSGARSDFKLETLNPTAAVTEPSRSACDASVQRSEVPQVFESGFDPDPSFEITVRKIGAGLENLGNTCFLNSVLQCLTYTEPLVAYLQSSKHQISCRNFGFCALCAIQKHVSSARQSTGRILAPMDFVSNLRFISRKFRSARQEDAHEYMVYLLESMHKCCFPSGVPIESPRSYEKSMVHKIFGGHLRSQVKCMQCSYYSNKFDPFLDLSLEIMKADSLRKALLHFTAIEYIEYQCQQCGQNVKASKQFTIDKSPYVLTIHLKRFGCSDLGHKIDKKVNFGLTLDLKPFLSDSDEGDQKYTLYGVLVHDGWSTHSGHYFCFVRTSIGMWYYLDDNRVIQVSEKAVLNQKAYMLFYVRDRKKNTPEQPVCVRKESFASSFTGQKTFPSSTLAVEVNGSASFAAAKNNAPNGPEMTDTAAVKREPVNKSSLNELYPVSGHFTLKPNFNGSANLVNAPATTNVRMKGFNENRTTHKDPSLPDLISAPCIERQPQSLITNKLASEKISQKVDFSLKESAALDATGEKSGSSKVKSCLISRKSKKKLLKYGFPSLRLGSSILLRRKHKRSKDRLLGTIDIYSEHLVDGSLASADLGPSTSEITKATSLHSTHSKRHGLNSNSKGANGTTAEAGLTVNSGCSIQCFDEEVKRRTDERNPILGGNKKPENCACPSLGSKQQGAGESGRLEVGRKVSTPNTLTGNFITLGLEDSSVARWDDAGSQLPSQILESSSADGMGVGYVLDEWDEEYDRGKRKKIRESKVIFGGPNPFQVVASKKARKLKNDESAKLRK